MEAAIERPRAHPRSRQNNVPSDEGTTSNMETQSRPDLDSEQVVYGRPAYSDGERNLSSFAGSTSVQSEDEVRETVDNENEQNEEFVASSVSTFHKVGEIIMCETGELHTDFEELDEKLIEQEIIFKGEQLKLFEKKDQCKEKVADLFKELRSILDLKERDILSKIDGEFDGTASFMDDVIASVNKDRTELLNNGLNSADERIKTLSDIYVEHDARDDVYARLRIPEFRVNNSLPLQFETLDFGAFEDTGTDYDTNSAISSENNDTSDPISDSISGSEVFVNLADAPRPTAQPTAPPMESTIPTVTVVGEVDDPPPYWQAVGLPEPSQTPLSPTPQIPSYSPPGGVVPLPENTLEFWHSFPIRRGEDRRQPLPCSLLWNYDWICLGDRANMKVKFFNPSGKLVSEVSLPGFGIEDVAFLETCHGESRYLVTCPRNSNSFKLLILFINAQGQSGVVHKFNTISCYSCVCRGPKEQMLVGGQSHHGIGPPRVEIFTFKDELVREINITPSGHPLQYPRSLEVWGDKIVISDWRLNTVMIVKDDGSNLGEYRGHPMTPLCNPIDITLDNYGNIMIMDGELAKIHVCDLTGAPIEVITVPRFSNENTACKLLAFEKDSKRLAITKSNGEIAIFTFLNGYRSLQQGEAPKPLPPMTRRQPEVLPLVEGMLPSTIENIVSRQGVRNRSRQFHL